MSLVRRAARPTRIVALVLLAWSVALLGQEGQGAIAVVDRLNAALTEVLRNAAQLGYEGRVIRLTLALAEAYDLDYMARQSLGLHWKKLSAEEQQRWLQLFREMTVANYAGHLTNYSGQRFETLREQHDRGETVIVYTRVFDPTKENVDLNYRLRRTEAGWKIIDVYLKGTVSEVALRRSDYTSFLKREGFASLEQHIRRQIDKLRATETSGSTKS